MCVIGAGRMGQGIAASYLIAGLEVSLIDLKPRAADEQARVHDAARVAVRAELGMLARLGVLSEDQADAALAPAAAAREGRCGRRPARGALGVRGRARTPGRQRDALRWLDEACPAETVVASTTSTFLVTELAALTAHPERFLNAHWLNPASLIPLVEVSRGPATRDAAADQLLELLRMAGKTPVMCAPSAGYIVPRIQALAMNEAARMVEEGVASAEDIDTAVRLGFGLRFSVLGLLEFIDWGGGDILYYASRYLAGAWTRASRRRM